MTASGEQQRDSAIYMCVCVCVYVCVCGCVSILPQTPLSSKLAHNKWAEFPALYRRSLFAIPFKYNSVYMSTPDSLTILSPHPFPWQP